MRAFRFVCTLLTVSFVAGAQAPTSTVRVNDPSTWYPTKSPTGKPTPSVQDARNNMHSALLACKSSIAKTSHAVATTTTKGDAKQIEESDWLGYYPKRDWAEHLEPNISAWDASFDPFSDLIPAHWISKCNAYFDEYVKGVGMTDLPLTKDCTNIVPVLTKIVKNKATEYTGPQTSPYHPNLVYPVRFALEDLRNSMYAPYAQGGYARCATPDRSKKAFLPYKQEFDQLEAQITAWETAKGMRFVVAPWAPPGDPRANAPQRQYTYVDLKTNQPCTGTCVK